MIFFFKFTAISNQISWHWSYYQATNPINNTSFHNWEKLKNSKKNSWISSKVQGSLWLILMTWAQLAFSWRCYKRVNEWKNRNNLKKFSTQSPIKFNDKKPINKILIASLTRYQGKNLKELKNKWFFFKV